MYYLRIFLYIFAGNNFMMILPSACHLWTFQVSTLHPAMGARSYESRRMFHRGQMSRFSAWDSPIFKKNINHPGDWNPGWCKIMKFTGCFVTFVQHLQVVQDVSSTESSLSNDVFFPEKLEFPGGCRVTYLISPRNIRSAMVQPDRKNSRFLPPLTSLQT